MTDNSTATLGQMIDALQRLAVWAGRDVPVVFYDHDTEYLQDVDPDDFIAPSRSKDGEIVLRSVGYHNEVGQPQGDIYSI